MFGGRIALIVGLCGGIVLYLGGKLSHSSEAERHAVQQLVDQTAANSDPGISTQRRVHVQRDLYTHSPSSERDHLSINGETADLVVDWTTGQTVERMTALKGVIEQEGAPMRRFIAKCGEFSQANHTLSVYKVNFSETEDDQVIHQGEAKECVVHLNRQPTQFQATQFIADSYIDAATVRADKAEYQENLVDLYGHASVILPAVRMAAQSIHLTRANSEVHKVHLEEQAEILFKDGMKVSCDVADVDLVEGKGRFAMNCGQVVLVMPREAGRNVIMTADELLVQAVPGPSEPWQLQQVIASGNVRVDDPKDWALVADTLIYEEREEGRLKLSSSGSNLCQVRKEGMGELSARSMTLNRGAEQVHALEAKGNLIDPQKEKIQFQGKELFWNHREREITLLQEVMVQQNDAVLETDDRLQLSYSEDRQPQRLFLTGNIVMSSAYPPRTVMCPGTCEVDFSLHKAHLVADTGEKQVRFEQGGTHLLADEVSLSYTPEGGVGQPQHLQAHGKVRVENKYGLGLGSNATQYALADFVDAWPSEHRLELSSQFPTRVLLLDSGNGLAISAPKVLLQPNASGKQQVRGIGDVRMTLLEKEYQQLKQRFHLKEKSPT